MTIATRTRMPDLRNGTTRKFQISYPDDALGEVTDLRHELERLAQLCIGAGVDPVAKDPRAPSAPPLRNFQFYVHANAGADGRLGEIFIKGDKLGGFMGGALDCLAMAISIGLQHGVPLVVFVDKLKGLQIGPSGRTGDKEFPMCTSMFDLLAKYLAKKFEAQIADEEREILEQIRGASPSDAAKAIV